MDHGPWFVQISMPLWYPNFNSTAPVQNGWREFRSEDIPIRADVNIDGIVEGAFSPELAGSLTRDGAAGMLRAKCRS
jgi:hypothetical protein